MNGKGKLLIVTSRWPYPPFGGDKLVAANVARALSGYQLTLLSLCGTREEMESAPTDSVFSSIHKVYLPAWRSAFNVLSALPGALPLQLAYYRSREFQEKFEQLLPQHDAIVAHLIRTGQYVERAQRRIPSVLVMSDAISLSYSRIARLPRTFSMWHWLYRIELKRLYAYERASPRNFGRVWLHSRIDQQFLAMNSDRVRIIPVGVDLNEFPFSPHTSGNVIAFIANMSSSLNRDACRHFLREIFPLLRQRNTFRFRIIGACPPSVQREFEKYPGVEVTGRIARIADGVEDVFCGVCPLRAGAGIQNKILNYLALGIPCVTSEIGLEGLNAVDGRDLFVYRDPREAVKLICDLYDNQALRDTIAASGRRFVEQAHDWSAVHSLMRRDIAELLGARS